MLSKNKISLITSLAHKKYRDETGLFIAEGHKLVLELAGSFNCEMLICTPEKAFAAECITANERYIVDELLLRKISGQKSPQGILGVFLQPVAKYDKASLSESLTLALDGIQDPGNLGTIIRLADWFGIRNIFCSLNTSDAFSPKTVQATMGALARVQIHYVDLPQWLNTLPALPIYGSFLEGRDIYSETLSPQGVIIMGNEGQGISPETEKLVTQKLWIPNFPKHELTSESLNVGVATAIICAEFRRRQR